jgi:sporulation protein YlmC with PRC-barrel domain
MKARSLLTASILALSLSGFAIAQESTTGSQTNQTTQNQPSTTDQNSTVTQPSTTDTNNTTTTTDQGSSTTTDMNNTAGQNTNTTDPNMANQPATTDQNQNQANQPSTTTDQNATAQNSTTGMSGDIMVGSDDLANGQFWTAYEFMGKTVYSRNNENVGEINDILFTNDGRIVGVVIGVGGFLGLGEKDVLVKLDAIQMTKAENSDQTQLVIDTSKEALEAAPTFDRVAKRYNNDGAGDAGMTGSGTTTTQDPAGSTTGNTGNTTTQPTQDNTQSQ